MAGNGMKGMDISAGETLVTNLGTYAESVRDLKTRLETARDALDENWNGDDSTTMLDRINTNIGQFDHIAQLLDARKDELNTDVQEQTDTSAQ